METQVVNTPITPENVLASVKEMFAVSRAEQDHRSAEFDLKLAKSREDHDRQTADVKNLLKVLGEQVGGWNNSHGLFAEEYFFNSFRGKKNFFGEKFDNIKKNLKGAETDDEFDIVLLNGHSVAIVETKFKARSSDVNNVINKVKAFKINYPKYQNHQFYIGLASLAFEKQAEQKCIEKGIAVIKQVGDAVVINDEHLKVF